MMSNDQSSTLRGHATRISYQHFTARMGGMAVKRPSAANLLTFDLDGQLVTLADESGLPVVNEGDEVEVAGALGGRANVFAASALTNHTTGQAWQFSMRRAMGRGAAGGALSGCLGNAVSVLVLLVVGLALMLALSACGGSAPAPTPTPAPTATATVELPDDDEPSPTPVVTRPKATPTLPPSPAPLTAVPTSQPAATRKPTLPDDPRAALTQAMRAQGKAMPFSVLSEITSGDTTLKTFVEFESPQRVRITSPSGSAVLYDGKFYAKEGQAAWREDSRAAATIAGFLGGMLDSAGVEAYMGMIKTVKQVGSETLDGIPCRIYEYTYAGEQFGVQTQGKVRLWVAEDDGLPIKKVTEGETAGYKATSTQSIDYGPDIKVEAPITR